MDDVSSKITSQLPIESLIALAGTMRAGTADLTASPWQQHVTKLGYSPVPFPEGFVFILKSQSTVEDQLNALIRCGIAAHVTAFIARHGTEVLFSTQTLRYLEREEVNNDIRDIIAKNFKVSDIKWWCDLNNITSRVTVRGLPTCPEDPRYILAFYQLLVYYIDSNFMLDLLVELFKPYVSQDAVLSLDAELSGIAVAFLLHGYRVSSYSWEVACLDIVMDHPEMYANDAIAPNTLLDEDLWDDRDVNERAESLMAKDYNKHHYACIYLLASVSDTETLHNYIRDHPEEVAHEEKPSLVVRYISLIPKPVDEIFLTILEIAEKAGTADVWKATLSKSL